MAKRFYFPSGTAADVSPAFDAGWDASSQGLRRKLNDPKGSTSLALGSTITVPDAAAGATALDRQYVSEPLAANILIDGTVKGQLMPRETNLNDNVDQVAVSIRVFDTTGATLRATLLALGTYAAADEFGVGDPNTENRKIADGDTLTPYTTQDGDRLVIELGYATSLGGSSPGARSYFGDASATDLPEDTTTTDLGTMNPWIEFSADFVPSEPATRFYLPIGSELYPSPASFDVDAGWERVRDSFSQHVALRSKAGVDNTGAHSDLFGDTTTSQTCYAQYVSEQLDVNQTIDGDVSIVVNAQEGGALTENAHLAFVLRVLGPDGTVRGTVASVMTTSTEFPAAFATRIHDSVVATPVAALAGDRLVMEIGVHGVTPANTNAVAIHVRTDETLEDLPLTADLTDALNTWWEINQEVTFMPEGSAQASGSPFATLSPFSSGTGTQTFNASGAAVATLSAFASGTAGTQGFVVGTGSPVATLSAFASGTATQTVTTPVSGSGSPVATLSPFAISGFPAVRQGARGGGAMRFITYEEPKEPKKRKRRKKRKPPETPESAQLEATEVQLPGVELSGIDSESMRRIRHPVRMPLPPAKSTKPEPEPDTRTVEDRLLEHFLESLGGFKPAKEEDMPFFLQRFLRMGQGE